MLDWINTNKSWLFDGVGVAAVAGLLTLFWRRFQKVPAPQVVVQLRENPATAPDRRSVDPVRVERIAPLTAAELQKALEDAPPLQRNAVSERFIGLNIEWDTLLRFAEEKEDGLVRLSLKPEGVSVFSLRCHVKLEDYRELGILPEDSLIRVYGTIKVVDLFYVELADAELKFMEPKKS